MDSRPATDSIAGRLPPCRSPASLPVDSPTRPANEAIHFVSRSRFGLVPVQLDSESNQFNRLFAERRKPSGRYMLKLRSWTRRSTLELVRGFSTSTTKHFSGDIARICAGEPNV